LTSWAIPSHSWRASSREAERIAVLGFSLGGLAALVVAVALRNRVGAVVAYDPALLLRDVSVSDDPISGWLTWVRDTLLASKTNDELRAACRIRMPELDDAALQRWTLRLSLLDPAVADLAELDRLLEGFDLDAALRSVRCPTLILRGRPELGSLIRDDDAEWAAARLAYGTIEQIRGAGHDIHNEQAGAVIASTRAFLRAARSAWSTDALPGPL
jgi:pimeloyl-ACP methyl ester carboxylesterase